MQPRGIRALSLVPHLSWNIIKEVSSRWSTLSQLRSASVEELQKVEGVGPYRAKIIHENLLHQSHMARAGLVGW